LLVSSLGRLSETDTQLDVLRGINEALKGRREVAMPRAWPGTFAMLAKSSNSQVRSQALALAVTFGDPSAFAEMRKLVADARTESGLRHNALAALLNAKDKELPPVLLALLGDASLRGPALRGLAMYDEAKTPAAVLAVYPSLNLQEKRDALNTLASRAVYAKALLEAVGAKKIAAADVSADIVRQLRNLQNKDINTRLAEVWGVVRDTPADRAKLMAHYKTLLTKPAKTPPDVVLGRAMFVKTCA